MARDIDDFQPKVGSRVLVWHPELQWWTPAFYLECGQFEEWSHGKLKVIRDIRWWTPMLEPPPQPKEKEIDVRAKVG